MFIQLEEKMTPLTMASDNTVEAHSNKDTAQDPGLEVVEEVEHHLRDSNEAKIINIIKIKLFKLTI